jgi:hypothetical protein
MKLKQIYFVQFFLQAPRIHIGEHPIQVSGQSVKNSQRNSSLKLLPEMKCIPLLDGPTLTLSDQSTQSILTYHTGTVPPLDNETCMA